MAYRIPRFLTTFSHLHGLLKWDFGIVVQQSTRFQLTASASRGPSAIAELLVKVLHLRKYDVYVVETCSVYVK